MRENVNGIRSAGPLDSRTDARVERLATRCQQAVVDRLAHQDMLEPQAIFDAFVRQDQALGIENRQRIINRDVFLGNRLDQRRLEAGADHGGSLQHSARPRRQPVKTVHQ
jgi:hypothetical protein